MKVIDVTRVNGKPQKVVLSSGDIEISFIRGSSGRPTEVSRLRYGITSAHSQSFWLPPANYRAAIRIASAVLR